MVVSITVDFFSLNFVVQNQKMFQLRQRILPDFLLYGRDLGLFMIEKFAFFNQQLERDQTKHAFLTDDYQDLVTTWSIISCFDVTKIQLQLSAAMKAKFMSQVLMHKERVYSGATTWEKGGLLLKDLLPLLLQSLVLIRTGKEGLFSCPI